MTYEDRISVARQILEDFNKSAANKVDIDQFFSKLTEFGAVNEELLTQVSWEDLQCCGIPRLLARQIASKFRKPDQDNVQRIVLVDQDPDKMAKSMSRRQLIEAYDYADAKNAVGERLEKLSEGRRFLVYHQDGTKNVDKSLSLLEGLDDFGELREVRATPPDNGADEVCEVLRVGEKPFQVVDEHPMFKDVPLRPDGTSKAGLDWSHVSFDVRQLIAVISRTEGWGDKTEADVLDDAESKGMSGLERRHMKAAMHLKRLKAEGKAPTLRISVRRNQANKTNNPFNVGQNRTT